MTITKAGSIAGAIMSIGVLVAAPIKFFETKAAAEDAKQLQAKSVDELREEFYLARIKAINEKSQPTKDEQDEKERLLALVKAIEEQQKVKEKK